MTTYVYSPFGDPDSVNEVRQWNDRRRSAGKSGRTLLKSRYGTGRLRGIERVFRGLTGQSVLSKVSKDDKLYVVAHGNRDQMGWYDIDSGLFGKVYTPARLAKNLLASGLRKDFYDLRLGICESGIEGNVDFFMNPLGLTFAARVFDEMIQLGYNGIRVIGYKGDWHPSELFDDGEYHSVVYETYDGKGHQGRASLFRVGYDASDLAEFDEDVEIYE